MNVSLGHLLGWMVSTFRSRENLVLEKLALRQQLVALHTQRPRRRLTALHKLFWANSATNSCAGEFETPGAEREWIVAECELAIKYPKESVRESLRQRAPKHLEKRSCGRGDDLETEADGMF